MIMFETNIHRDVALIAQITAKFPLTVYDFAVLHDTDTTTWIEWANGTAVLPHTKRLLVLSMLCLPLEALTEEIARLEEGQYNRIPGAKKC